MLEKALRPSDASRARRATAARDLIGLGPRERTTEEVGDTAIDEDNEDEDEEEYAAAAAK